MKLNKTNLIFAVLVLGFFLVSNTASAQTESTTGAAPKSDIKKTMQARDGVDQARFKEEIGEVRGDIREEKKAEVKNIKETTRNEVKDLKEKMLSERKDPRSAGSIEEKKEIRLSNKEAMENFKTARKDAVKKMKTEEFKTRANALVKQLNISLEYLNNSRTKINDIITKQEASGKVLTDAKAALAVADTKIAAAKSAVEALNGLAATTETSTETDLAKPRQLGDAAIKAVKEARDALKEVVKHIAPKSGTASTTPIKN